MRDLDILKSNGMIFWGNHGLTHEQNVMGTKFIIDIEVVLDMSNQFAEDQLSSGLTYTDLFQITQQVITQEHYKTIQRVAQRIADEVRGASGTPIEQVTVTVKEPYPAIPGSNVEYVGFTLTA